MLKDIFEFLGVDPNFQAGIGTINITPGIPNNRIIQFVRPFLYKLPYPAKSPLPKNTFLKIKSKLLTNPKITYKERSDIPRVY